MLAIRMQRTGRSGHAMFRVVVQDARRTPTSGKIVAQLGSYDPHTKALQIAKDKASYYLEHGAQPSDRVARLLKAEGVKLPNWVSLEAKQSKSIRNPEKLRRNRPAGAEAPPVKQPASETPTEAEQSPNEAESSAENAQTTEAIEVEANTETTAEAPKTEVAEAETAETEKTST